MENIVIDAVYSYLAADSTLLGLLGGTASDPRIYPDVAPQDTATPYIVYRVQHAGSRDEILDDITIQYVAVTDTTSAGDAISYRLKTLLDKQDQIVISATNDQIFWSKHIGGDSFFEDGEGIRVYHRVLMFALKFRRK